MRKKKPNIPKKTRVMTPAATPKRGSRKYRRLSIGVVLRSSHIRKAAITTIAMPNHARLWALAQPRSGASMIA